MDIYTATEEAYKKGYEDGKRDGLVRCKDCMYFTPDEICFQGSGSCWFCEMTRKFEDFCSYGERRSNAAD